MSQCRGALVACSCDRSGTGACSRELRGKTWSSTCPSPTAHVSSMLQTRCEKLICTVIGAAAAASGSMLSKSLHVPIGLWRKVVKIVHDGRIQYGHSFGHMQLHQAAEASQANCCVVLYRIANRAPRATPGF